MVKYYNIALLFSVLNMACQTVKIKQVRKNKKIRGKAMFFQLVEYSLNSSGNSVGNSVFVYLYFKYLRRHNRWLRGKFKKAIFIVMHFSNMLKCHWQLSQFQVILPLHNSNFLTLTLIYRKFVLVWLETTKLLYMFSCLPREIALSFF